MRKPGDAIARFWTKVDRAAGPCGCWMWLGFVGNDGYGQFRVGSHVDGSRRSARPHRFVWEIERGAIPDGALICHTCDERLCVNPSHLFICSHAKNAQDMLEKGRSPWMNRATRRSRGRLLTEAEVTHIRCQQQEGMGCRRLAAMTGIPMGAILHVLRGTTWKGIECPPGGVS